ncbi:hypothetical protein [Chitinimonas sp.]|uniref:hypothetical protein n=1 Tax=Chitinimonas sp. TaxID=1934313 RepID=UPI002F91ECBB
MSTTTHLVCAPDDLDYPAVVSEWLIAAGSVVVADTPLLKLAVAGATKVVLTPMDGVLSEHCVAVGEPLAACDLLAMIEAEEPEFGLLIAPEDADDNLSVAACKQAFPAATGLPPTASPRLPQQALPVSFDAEALALCAALGLAPDELPLSGLVGRREVERFVRQELRTLDALRALLQR